MLYITLLDQFHPGIYSSQVIDVCDYLNKKHNAKIRLLAFLSIRELQSTNAKKKIKELSPDAIVLPAFPGLKNFQLTAILLFFVCLFTGERKAICRNVFCTRMALRIKKVGLLKKVVFDGRSAMSSEIEEYDVFPVDYLRKNVREFEKYVVLNADFRMAVSQQLVSYWKEFFDYTGDKHVVIPCTLDRKHFNTGISIDQNQVSKIKSELGIRENEIVFVYSGSTAPWQSFLLLKEIFGPLLKQNERIKILFLSKSNKDNEQFAREFPGRVFIKWLEHKDILTYLACCDYGILTRNQSYTNKVASPTKFAEYLYAGLSVVISENLGDFSKFVEKHNCGIVINEDSFISYDFEKLTSTQIERNKLLAENYFFKDAKVIDSAYKRIVTSLNN